MADDTKPEDRPIVTRAKAKTDGVKRYFTGRPCLAGHVAERLVSNGQCLICSDARTAAYRATPQAKEKSRATSAAHRAANREKRRAYCVAWRAANPEKFLAAVVAWSAANTDKINARRRVWRAANREKFAARYAAYTAANREKRRARDAAMRAAHPEKHRTDNMNRRARKLKVGGKHSAADITSLFKMQQGKCAHPWCRKRLSDEYHVDHILPLAIGGSNDRRNLQILCQPCNLTKHATHPVDFAQRHGMLL